MPTETHPTTVEELLAAQQAELERLGSLVEAQQEQIALSAQTGASQGEVIHRDSVSKRIRALNGVYPPSILLAAQQVLLGDKPWLRPAEDAGFNLSVQVPKADAPGEFEARKLSTPSEIVSFMLAAIPTVEGKGNAAVQLAAINSGLDEFNLAAHRTANASDPEAEAVSAVDEWERGVKPHLFNADGTRKAA